MTKTLHGKVHGKTIELDEDLGVAEGQEVEVQVTDDPSQEAAARTTARMAAWFQANGRGDVGGFVDGGG